MKMSKNLLVLFLTISLFTAGCAATTIGRKIDNNNISHINKGATTKNQIRTSFGEPDGKNFLSSKEMWNYSYSSTKGSMGVGGILASIITFGLYNPVKVQSESQNLMITFQDDTVVDFNYSEGGIGGGGF